MDMIHDSGRSSCMLVHSSVVQYADRGNSLLEEGCCARVVNGNYDIVFISSVGNLKDI